MDTPPTPDHRDDITYRLIVSAPPEAVFAAINDVRGWWWGEIDGVTDRVGGEFTYRYEALHTSTQRVVELVPGRRVVWRVEDAHLTFLRDAAEWKGTHIVFDLTPRQEQTEIVFTHVGLSRDCECFGACNDAWGTLIRESLRGLITEGRRGEGRRFGQSPADA